MLGAGFWLKEQCLGHAWEAPESWFCYSDMDVLYRERGFDHDRIPYVQEFNEYPPVVAGVQYGAALLTDTHTGWAHLNEAVLAACALGTTLCLGALAGPRWRLLVWTLGPPLGLYAFHNWDLLAVLATAAGLLLFSRGMVGWAGAALALGFHAKVYPALLLLILGMDLLRQDGGLSRRGWRFGLAAVGTLVGVAAPFLAIAPGAFLETFAFHVTRGPTLESAANALWHLADLAGVAPAPGSAVAAALAALAGLLLLALLTLLALAVRRGRLPWMEACLGALAALLLLSQVMSLQYALWVLPFLAVLPVPAWLVGAFLAADAACYITVFSYFGHDDDAHFAALGMATLARAAAYLLLVGWVLWGLRRPARAPAAAPAPA
jgi:hypothetical protein